MQRNQELQMKKRVVPGLRQQVNSASTNNLSGLLASSGGLGGNASMHIASSSHISTATLSLVDDDAQLAKINKYHQLGTDSHLNALMMSSQSTSSSIPPSTTAIAATEPQSSSTTAGVNSGVVGVTEEAFDISSDLKAAANTHTADDPRGGSVAGGEALLLGGGGGVLGEVEEQLAEALFRRAQAKLMIDCFNHNTTAFIDGLMPGALTRRSPEVAMLEAALQDSLRVRRQHNTLHCICMLRINLLLF